MFRSGKRLSSVQLFAWGIAAIAWEQIAATAQSAAPDVRQFRFGHGILIQIVAPPEPLKVAEKAEISLILHNKGLTSVVATQNRYLDPEHKFRDVYGIDGGDQTLPVRYRPDGSAYIELIPLRLGEIELTVFGSFPDRASDRNSAFIQVVPSERKPIAMIVGSAGRPDTDTDILRLNLDDSHPWAQGPKQMAYLYPAAYYLDLHVPIEVDRPFARFTVRQPEDDPVIEFDQTSGGMKPLRRGAALVETFYGGLVKRTCVLVRVARDINDRGDCEPLFSSVRPTVTAPLDTTWMQNPYGMSNEFVWGVFEFPTDRLEVAPPDHPVEFAQALRIPVKTSRGKVVYYTVAQSRPGITNYNGQRIAPGADGTPLTSITLVPLQFDDDLVVITAHFADDGVSQRYFRLHVMPSGKGLKSVELHTFPAENGYLRVTATLKYEQLKDPAQLPDLKQMTYRIDQGAIPDVLHIEQDGRIRQLHTGQAALVATFCGVTGGVLVNVHEPVQ
jgi:hypothetical protein